MGKKVNKFLKGQIATTIFYIILGLCLVIMPVKTVDVLCKVVFGLVIIGSGLYHIYVYLREKENTTILDLFSGVMVLVIGGFLFTNPQVVIKLLPVMLGAFVIVDSIWTLRGGLKLKKRGIQSWKEFLAESLIFVGLGIFLIVYPFQSVNVMLMFAGWIFLCNGILDMILYIILQKGLKKEVNVQEKSEERPENPVEERSGEESENPVEERSWEDSENPVKERTMKEPAAPTAEAGAAEEETVPAAAEKREEQSEGVSEEMNETDFSETAEGEENLQEAEPEVLEEWKD